MSEWDHPEVRSDMLDQIIDTAMADGHRTNASSASRD